MLKILGSACILGGGTLAWYFQALERRREMDTLSNLLSALQRMAEEIRMARTSLPVLLERLSEGYGPDADGFFRAAAAAVRQGEPLPEAWRRAASGLPMSGFSQAALAELGEDFQGDEESICKAISLAVLVLSRDMEERTRRRQEEGKRAAALYLSGAALLVILLI